MSYRRPETVALALVALGALVHYGYKPFPEWAQPDVQNVCIAVAFIVFALWVAWRVPGWPVVGATALWVAEEALRAGCSIAYLIRGAANATGGDQCTGLIRLDLNYLGVFALSFVLVSTVKVYRVRE